MTAVNEKNTGVPNRDGMWQEEERIKNTVYSVLDDTLEKNADAVKRAMLYVESDAFEEKDAFIAHNDFTSAKNAERKSIHEFASILRKPYFAHMDVACEDSATLRILLSDSADLDRVINIDATSQIVPFKQSKEAPMLTALFHQYQARESSPFTVSVRNERYNEIYVDTYSVELIRDVEVTNRIIENVVQLLPKTDSPQTAIEADELLGQRLDENRTNAQLRNIISTLQLQQFEVIKADEKDSFVVQGCAGSGKTQCLIHRLFFLRDVLGEHGWNQVLLITPTQLFRNYSSELIRRYHLSNVRNSSLASLYYSLLDAFDPRFKSRQYRVEISEEYLPDGYLSQVYSGSHIATIEQEILSSLRAHVEEGCSLTGNKCPADWCSAGFISTLVVNLDSKITEFDERASSFSKNTEYSVHLSALDKADKHLASLLKKQQALALAKEDLEQQKEKYDALLFEIENAEDELKAYKLHLQHEREIMIRELAESVHILDKETPPTQEHVRDYSRKLYHIGSSTLPQGKIFKKNKDEQQFLEDILSLAQQDLLAFTENLSQKAWLRRFSDKAKTNEISAKSTQTDIDIECEAVELHRKWIQDYTMESDSIENQRNTFRSSLEKARYYLSRIESSVFEQEVWNALTPLKEKYHIQTIQIEQIDDNHQKQTKILYKSDLLFYLKIYQLLHSNDSLPQFSLICIDEGQDLHSADYLMLKKLYPHAAFNVFGDTAQALHEACGISNWPIETGIETIYPLKTNYRNAPAIVEFCNKRFSSNMEWLGSIRMEQTPKVLKSADDMRQCIRAGNNVVIVKNRNCFIMLCNKLDMTESEFDYLDTNSDKEAPGKIHCYSVFAAKGLEFPKVAVFAGEMTINQKIVACTRAMECLFYWE